MIFENVENSIFQILTDAANNRYRTADYEVQTIGAEEVEGNNRLVEIFYSSGEFNTNKNAQYSTGAMHDMNITINLYVAAQAKGDLTTLNNPSATPAEKQAALAAFVMASKQAHASLNELFRIIYLILMDGENIDLGLPIGTITDRWISGFTKNPPATQGELFLLTGTFTYNCSAYEDFTGATPIPSISIDTVIDIEDDDIEKTGVEVDNN